MELDTYHIQWTQGPGMQGLGIWELRTYIGTWKPETQIGMYYVCMYVQVSPIAGLEYGLEWWN